MTQKSLIDASRESFPADTEEEAHSVKAEAAMLTEKEIIDLYNAADPDAKKAAASLLKGERLPDFDSLAVFTEKTADRDIKNKLKGFFNADTGKALLNGAKNLLGGENSNEPYGRSMSIPLMAFTYFYSRSLMSGVKNKFIHEKENDPNGRSVTVPYMAFTYFYSLSHYIFLLSFYFWLWRKDIKPEK